MDNTEIILSPTQEMLVKVTDGLHDIITKLTALNTLASSHLHQSLPVPTPEVDDQEEAEAERGCYNEDGKGRSACRTHYPIGEFDGSCASCLYADLDEDEVHKDGMIRRGELKDVEYAGPHPHFAAEAGLHDDNETIDLICSGCRARLMSMKHEGDVLFLAHQALLDANNLRDVVFDRTPEELLTPETMELADTILANLQANVETVVLKYAAPGSQEAFDVKTSRENREEVQ